MPIRKKINKMNESEYGVDTWERNIVFDGKQFLIRIPKEVSDVINIKKGDIFEFTLKSAEQSKPLEDSELIIKYVRKNDKKKK